MNTRQSLFVDYYSGCLNATKSALDAGYSPKTAYSQGQRLLKNVEVQEALVIRKAALAERAEITAVDVLKMLQREARCWRLGRAQFGTYQGSRTDRETHRDVQRHLHQAEHRNGGAANQHPVWRQGG